MRGKLRTMTSSEAHFPGAAPLRRPLAVLLGALMLSPSVTSCGDSAESKAPPEVSRPTASSADRRDMRAEAVEARRLLGDGRADLARPLVDRLVETLEVEGPLLRARLAFLEGDDTGWLKDIEAGRSQDPRDPRPYATAAEIYAALDRRLAATEEIERGIAAVGGMTAELKRATGIVAIVTPGQGKAGLDLLESARREDGELPFLARPLGQAHYLAAKRALSEGNGELALERITKSLEWDPKDIDARMFQADTIISVHTDFKRGLQTLEALFAEGMPIQAKLGKFQWSAGLQAQLQRRDDDARLHYLRARELRYPGVENGTSRDFLQRQANAALDAAVEAARGAETETVRSKVQEALSLSFPEPAARRGFAARFSQEAERALASEDMEFATECVAAAVWIDSDSQAAATASASLYFALALDAMGGQDVETALAFAVRATESTPDDPMMWLFRGELEHSKGAFDVASGSLEKALTLGRAAGDAVEIGTILKIAECLVLTGDEEGAIGTLEQGLSAVIKQEPAPDPTELDEAREYLRILRR